MRRTLYTQLLKWKNNPCRKPLILEGARQVGKTWLIKEFGKNEFDDFVYVNCAEQSFAKTLFTINLIPQRIVRDIIANTTKRIVPGKTLIIFDEIQEAPHGISSLKYFCEKAPDYHIIAAGSLLGVVHHSGESYPVGKVDILRLFPMSFEEFLWAKGYDTLAEIISNCEWDSINVQKEILEDLLRQYYYVGGMPEVVDSWTKQHDVLEIRTIQNRILSSYMNDISKHAGTETERIRKIWQSIPAQLAKENKKFIYGAIKKGGRAKEFETAIQWLIDAGLVYKIYRSKNPQIPLKFYEDFNAFKLYLIDVGLLGALSGATPAQMLISNSVFREFKGAFAENYVLQQIILNDFTSVSYYSKDNSKVEIDFLVQTNTNLFAIEVKAEENVKSKSLSQFITKDYPNNGIKAIRCSMKQYINQSWMENIPLYSIESYIRI